MTEHHVEKTHTAGVECPIFNSTRTGEYQYFSVLSPSDSRRPGQFRNEWQDKSARLQSFLDDHLFVGRIAKQHQMTGNAVPPLLGRPVAEAIAKEILPA